MYRFSRSIYRELAPRVVEDEWDPTECANKQKVLDACEGAICRLTYDRRYFARPTRTLFNDVRGSLHDGRPAVRLDGDRAQHRPGDRVPFALARRRRARMDGRRSARRIRAGARRVSAGRSLAGTIARRTSTWRRRSRPSSRRSRPSTATPGSHRRLAGKRAGDDPGPGRDRHLPGSGPDPPGVAVGSGDAARSRRRRDVHRRRALRRTRPSHGEGPDHP